MNWLRELARFWPASLKKSEKSLPRTLAVEVHKVRHERRTTHEVITLDSDFLSFFVIRALSSLGFLFSCTWAARFRVYPVPSFVFLFPWFFGGGVPCLFNVFCLVSSASRGREVRSLMCLRFSLACSKNFRKIRTGYWR